MEQMVQTAQITVVIAQQASMEFNWHEGGLAIING